MANLGSDSFGSGTFGGVGLLYPIDVVRLFRNVQPWYRTSDYIAQMFHAWQTELDQMDRWTHYEAPQDLFNVLAGNWLYNHEGILAAWLARESSDPYLSWWENMLGIPTDTTIPDQARRNYLIQRMQQRGQSPTPQYIKTIAEKFVTTVAIIPNIPGYSFVVQVLNPRGYVAPNIRANMQIAIDAAKPAHLAYTINSIEEDWNTIKNADWHAVLYTDWMNLGSIIG
jgi:hypothetical protein